MATILPSSIGNLASIEAYSSVGNVRSRLIRLAVVSLVGFFTLVAVYQSLGLFSMGTVEVSSRSLIGEQLNRDDGSYVSIGPMDDAVNVQAGGAYSINDEGEFCTPDRAGCNTNNKATPQQAAALLAQDANYIMTESEKAALAGVANGAARPTTSGASGESDIPLDMFVDQVISHNMVIPSRAAAQAAGAETVPYQDAMNGGAFSSPPPSPSPSSSSSSSSTAPSSSTSSSSSSSSSPSSTPTPLSTPVASSSPSSSSSSPTPGTTSSPLLSPSPLASSSASTASQSTSTPQPSPPS